MDLINVYKKVITDKSVSWVLFRHGTCVMLMEPKDDLQAQAKKILKEHGLAIAGTPSGDFEVIKIPEIEGWIITGDYPGIMDYVSLREGEKKSDFEIGMLGREKREADAKELKIINVIIFPNLDR